MPLSRLDKSNNIFLIVFLILENITVKKLIFILINRSHQAYGFYPILLGHSIIFIHTIKLIRGNRGINVRKIFGIALWTLLNTTLILNSQYFYPYFTPLVYVYSIFLLLVFSDYSISMNIPVFYARYF